MKQLFTLTIATLLSTCTFAQWMQQTSPVTDVLSEVTFVDDDNGYIAGYDHILKTTDGGQAWQIAHSGAFIVEGIDATSATHVYASGYDPSTDKSAMIWTADGGQTWADAAREF